MFAARASSKLISQVGVRLKSASAGAGSALAKRSSRRTSPANLPASSSFLVPDMWSLDTTPPSPFDLMMSSSPLATTPPTVPSILNVMDSLLGGGLSPMLRGGMMRTLLPDPRRLQREVDRAMERTLGIRNMALDVVEKPESYEIHCEVPGIAKDNISVEMDEENRYLMITCEKSSSSSSTGEGGEGISASPAKGKKGRKQQKEQQEMGSTESAAANSEDSSTSSTSSTSSDQQSSTSSPKEKGMMEKSTTTTSPSTSDSNVPSTTTTNVHTERSFGLLRRTLWIPQDVDIDRITSKLDRGVLTIVLPKVMPASGGGEKEGRRVVNIE